MKNQRKMNFFMRLVVQGSLPKEKIAWNHINLKFKATKNVI